MSTTKGLDLDEGSVCNHDLDLGYIGTYNQWIRSWLRKCLRPRSWSWRRKCLRPIDMILTEETSVTTILILATYVPMTNGFDLDWGNICNHDLNHGYVGAYNQWIWSWLKERLLPRSWSWLHRCRNLWIWSWLRKCLRPRSWSWLRRCLWQMDLILTEEMATTMILILTTLLPVTNGSNLD